MDGRIRRWLIEIKCSSKSIRQWYERAARLNRNCRESKREEEEGKERKRIEDEWRRIEGMKIKIEKEAEREWR